MIDALPEYALAEIERRFLVDPARLPPLGAPTRVSDRYLVGTRLRLRVMVAPGAAPVYKLTRKYGGTPPSEPIVTAYLTLAEHALLATLPADALEKDRYHVDHDGRRFAVDHIRDFWLAEIECRDLCDAAAVVAPGWTTREITGETVFSGATLARGH